MLGRRDPQRSLFEAHAWPHRVPEDSFYARMGAVNDVSVQGRRPGRDVLRQQWAAQRAAVADEWHPVAAILRRRERRGSHRATEL